MLATSFVVTLGLGGAILWADSGPETPAVVPEVVVTEPEPPRFSEVSHAIRRGDTLGAIVAEHGVSDVDAVVVAAAVVVPQTAVR